MSFKKQNEKKKKSPPRSESTLAHLIKTLSSPRPPSDKPDVTPQSSGQQNKNNLKPFVWDELYFSHDMLESGT